MNPKQANLSNAALCGLEGLLPELESLYKDIHSHPELSMREDRTAGLAADRLKAAGYDVTTGVGKTGVVGLFRNGDGPTVMLRADMDALPVEEATGLAYSSKATATDNEGKSVPVSHNRLNELPVNHSPKFAPVLHPTLRTGVETLVVATQAWLSSPQKG